MLPKGTYDGDAGGVSASCGSSSEKMRMRSRTAESSCRETARVSRPNCVGGGVRAWAGWDLAGRRVEKLESLVNFPANHELDPASRSSTGSRTGTLAAGTRPTGGKAGMQPSDGSGPAASSSACAEGRHSVGS